MYFKFLVNQHLYGLWHVRYLDLPVVWKLFSWYIIDLKRHKTSTVSISGKLFLCLHCKVHTPCCWPLSSLNFRGDIRGQFLVWYGTTYPVWEHEFRVLNFHDDFAVPAGHKNLSCCIHIPFSLTEQKKILRLWCYLILLWVNYQHHFDSYSLACLLSLSLFFFLYFFFFLIPDLSFPSHYLYFLYRDGTQEISWRCLCEVSLVSLSPPLAASPLTQSYPVNWRRTVWNSWSLNNR